VEVKVLALLADRVPFAAAETAVLHGWIGFISPVSSNWRAPHSTRSIASISVNFGMGHLALHRFCDPCAFGCHSSGLSEYDFRDRSLWHTAILESASACRLYSAGQVGCRDFQESHH
jgi:hypothetical protein